MTEIFITSSPSPVPPAVGKAFPPHDITAFLAVYSPFEVLILKNSPFTDKFNFAVAYDFDFKPFNFHKQNIKHGTCLS